MKTIGIIPARGGSKSIPRKNIRSLNGKPLLYYTVHPALKSNLDKVVVSTEDFEIKSISEEMGVQVIHRPNSLAEDTSTTHDVIIDCLKRLEDNYDAIMVLQPTSPFRSTQHINDCLDMFSKDKKADSLVSVQKATHNMIPSSLMEKKGKYLDFYTKGPQVYRRQDKEEYFARNGAAIYLTRSEKISKYIIGGNISYYIMSKIHSIDIDEMEDLIIAESLIKCLDL